MAIRTLTRTLSLVAALAAALGAAPAAAQEWPCDCDTPATIERVVIVDCDAAPCHRAPARWHPAHRRPPRPHWHWPRPAPAPHPRHPWHPAAPRPIAAGGSAALAALRGGGAVATGNSVLIYTGSGGPPLAIPSPGTPVSPANPGTPAAPDSSAGNTAATIAALSQRLERIDTRTAATDSWLGRLGWWVALGAVLLALPLLLLALWALLRGVRAAPAVGVPGDTGAGAGDKVRKQLKRQSAAIERLQAEFASLHHAFEHRGERRSAAEPRPAHHSAPHHHAAAAAEGGDAEILTLATPVVMTAAEAASRAAPRPRAAPAHPARRGGTVIEETVTGETVGSETAGWSIADYEAAIEAARRQPHSRAAARGEVVDLSDRLIAAYPHHAEASSLGHLRKAEALAEAGDHPAAMAHAETVITRHRAAANPRVRRHLADAHYLVAALFAQHGDLSETTTALDQWAAVRGRFDAVIVREDVRFATVLQNSAFADYVARKSA